MSTIHEHDHRHILLHIIRPNPTQPQSSQNIDDVSKQVETLTCPTLPQPPQGKIKGFVASGPRTALGAAMFHVSSEGFFASCDLRGMEMLKLLWFKLDTCYKWLVVTGCHEFGIFPFILGMSSSQLTNSYFSEGWRKTTNQLQIEACENMEKLSSA